MSATTHEGYYVPHGSHWPIIGSISLSCIAIGAASYVNEVSWGGWLLSIGLIMMIFMMYGWFADVTREGLKGLFNEQVDLSFRWGMGWFIFSEVMFFGAFFGALFYARMYSIPWLGGAGAEAATHEYLWPSFDAVWPLLNPPGAANMITNVAYDVPSSIVGAWGLPAINTALLLTSGVTVTLAHHALKRQERSPTVLWLLATVALGYVFVGLQAYEYMHAINDFNLTLQSGIYGSTFYMLTGFHGAHVTIGATMLVVIMFKAMAGHFTPEKHFAFEAVAWYWHFVDVVWLGLFIFVYWI